MQQPFHDRGEPTMMKHIQREGIHIPAWLAAILVSSLATLLIMTGVSFVTTTRTVAINTGIIQNHDKELMDHRKDIIELKNANAVNLETHRYLLKQGDDLNQKVTYLYDLAIQEGSSKPLSRRRQYGPAK